MKKILTAIVLILCFMQRDAYAQDTGLQLFSVPSQPVPAGAAVTINGSGFSKDLSQISVRVGTGSLCKPLQLSDAGDGTQNLLIQLAPQAANGYLYVTQNGLVATSSHRVNVVSGCNQTTDISSASFSSPGALVTANAGEKISCVAIGDLNNDGQMNVVSPRDSHTGLATGKRMVINYGGGKEDTISTWGEVTSIELADMDGDGLLDILTTEEISPVDTTADDTIQVNLYKKHLANVKYEQLSIHGEVYHGTSPGMLSDGRLAAIDLDHDGKPDILYVSATNGTAIYGGTTLINDDPLHQQGEVRVFQNTGDATFTEASAAFLTNASDSLVEAGDSSLSISDLNLGIGDFNGDGLPDIAVYHAINTKGAGSGNRIAQVSYSQRCDGNNSCLNPSFQPQFHAINTKGAGSGNRQMATGDLDGDGFDDIVLCGGDSAFILSGRQLSCNCSEDETTIDLSTFLHQGGGAAACTLTDINADGKLDIAFLSEPDASGSKGSSLTYFQNTSSSDGITGNLIAEGNWNVPDSIADFTTADMDGDGKPDLIFASSETDGTVSLSKNVQACSDVVTVCDPGCFHSSNNAVINGNFNNIVQNQSYTPTTNYSSSTFSDKSKSGTYLIGTSGPVAMSNWCGSDHTSGSGNMMMQNGFSGSKTSAWGQLVSVLPNTNYTFSAYVNNLTCSSKNYSDPKIELHVNGKIVSSTLTLTENPDQWIFLSGTWFSGNSPGATATIEIVDKSTSDKGNDFAIDDIQFYGCLPNLVANAGADVSMCKSSSVQLSAKGVSSVDTSFTYSWSPATGLNATDIPNPVASPLKTTTYTVTITGAKSACSQSDVVKVTVNQNPAPKITAIGSLSVCSPQCASLTANTASGLSYQWLLNGMNAPGNNTSPNYQACSSGSYQVLETTSNGCAKTSNALQVSVTNCREENEVNTTSLLLYPNPASDKVTVSFASDQNTMATLRLCDLSGKVLFQQQIQVITGVNTQTISTNDLAGGIYIVSIATETGILNSKLIKQ